MFVHLLIKMKRNYIAIDSEIASKLREFAFNKHGTLRGCLKSEAEMAILKHMEKED